MTGHSNSRRSSGHLTAITIVALLAVGLAAAPGDAQGSPAAITLRPECGPAGSAITVDGTQFNPFSAVLVTFDAGPGGRPESFPARTDGFGRFTVEIQPSERPDGSHLVRADDFKRREATATFVIPCPVRVRATTTTSTTTPVVPSVPPSLVMEPPLAPPGFITEAVGRGFPPGATIELVWLVPALGPAPVPALTVTADGDGGFRVPVLIFHRESLGPRQMNAAVTDVPDPPRVSAAFLVVPANAQPRDFRNRR